MYLRNEYATIAEYNEQAGVIAEKYHFLVVADFPVNFTETAAKRLHEHRRQRRALRGVSCSFTGTSASPAARSSFPMNCGRTASASARRRNQLPAGGQAARRHATWCSTPRRRRSSRPSFCIRSAQSSRDSSRVEVPFEQVRPARGEDLDARRPPRNCACPSAAPARPSSRYLAIGKGTCQHALVAGKTGSGKSTLFHVIITNLALWCSPEQVEFYLVDFKKGVEFKCYATHRLPHARVVAIESDREFGLSVLQRVDEELRAAATCSASSACRTSPATSGPAAPNPCRARC